jgi:hypothetical protein
MRSFVHLFFRSAILLIAALSGFTLHCNAGLRIPYVPDGDTLHLWHLDGPAALTTPDAVPENGITLTNIGEPSPGTGPYTNANLGSPSFSGLGNSLHATTKQHLLYGGAFSDVLPFSNPESGAFTFEAVVKFDIDPLGASDMEIISGDNGLGIGNRGWQWRIFNGVMEWDLLAGATDNDFKAPLPKTGPDAAITNTWYHVAITYTGDNPTNGDSANVVTFYWTALDANRTAADPLAQYAATRPLNGAPLGQSQPGLGIGGSARNTTTNPGNNEGWIGSMDEIRISNVALTSNQMAFNASSQSNPPTFTKQPPTNTVVAYGHTLTIPALVSGTAPLSYQWLLNGTNLPGQAGTTLQISNVTFSAQGTYTLVVTNTAGNVTSQPTEVTVGGAASGLFNTGLTTNGIVSDGDIADPHWTLFRSDDINYLGPNVLIFENSDPLQFASANGSFSPANGVSMWIGPAGNAGGVATASPAGNYIYRAQFLIDTADASTMTMGGNLWANGSITDILVNGKSTGITLAPGGTLYVTTFSITNGFKQGVNTLDFVENLASGGIAGIRVEINSLAAALPAGLPVITTQPSSQTVRDGTVAGGSQASFSVVATGRSPLTYQWYADGTPLNGATNRTLTFSNPTAGAQGTHFSVVVSNDSGSVTSQVPVLTLVSSNQPPVAANFSFVSFQGQPLDLSLSEIVQSSVDPDDDAISFVGADASSTNAAGAGNVNQVNASIEYTPVEGAVGLDQFGYTISDALSANAQGFVNILTLLSPGSQLVTPGGTAHFDAGITNLPGGYTLQWQHNGTNIAGANAGMLTITNTQINDAGTYRLVVTDPLGKIWTSPGGGLTVGNPGLGTGLAGDYYSDMTNGVANFSGQPTLTQLDPTIDFDWASGAPDPSITPTYFMVRWHGKVQPLYTEPYTFYTTTDDGARLWVDGKLLVNRWQAQAATTASGTIALTANQSYDLVMEYFQATSADVARLSWSSAHQPQEIIPSSRLFPDSGALRTRLTVGMNNRTNGIIDWAGTFNLQTATDVTGPWTTVAASAVGPFSTNFNVGQKFFRLITP